MCERRYKQQPMDRNLHNRVDLWSIKAAHLVDITTGPPVILRDTGIPERWFEKTEEIIFATFSVDRLTTSPISVYRIPTAEIVSHLEEQVARGSTTWNIFVDQPRWSQFEVGTVSGPAVAEATGLVGVLPYDRLKQFIATAEQSIATAMAALEAARRDLEEVAAASA
jgi:hypothetical protein